MSAKRKNSKAFNTMAVLSYIGNGVWGLLFTILLIGCITNGAAIASSGGFSELFGGAVGFMAIMAVVVIVLCILSIRGVAQMKKGNRSGFLSYLIGNGMWVLLLIYGGRDGSVYLLSTALVSVAFIGYFAVKLPKLS